MAPKNGGKIELRLGPATSDSAEYSAELATAAGSWRGAAQVGATAGAQQVAFGSWLAVATSVLAVPPDWLLADARAALKAALRTSRAESKWPRRITRWRPEPD